MEMCSLVNTKTESHMVRENMSGKMELTTKEISYKGLEMGQENGTKTRTVFMKVNLNKIISMEKESNITKTEVICKAILLKVKYQRVLIITRKDKLLGSIMKVFRKSKSHEIL